MRRMHRAGKFALQGWDGEWEFCLDLLFREGLIEQGPCLDLFVCADARLRSKSGCDSSKSSRLHKLFASLVYLMGS